MGEQLTLSVEQRRDEWTGAVRDLIDQIESWCQAEGWAVKRDDKEITEDRLGTYHLPMLRIRVPKGELHVEPVALHVIGSAGRVDLEAWPTLNRVKLIRREKPWVVITDSNVPLREPWSRDLFARLADDLLS